MLNAVTDLNMDPSGNSDCSGILQGYLDGNNDEELHFPPGKYKFDHTVKTNAKNVKLIGDAHLANMGDSPVRFVSDKTLDAILWWDGSQSNSNMNGPRLDHIQFQGANLKCAIRLTATANMELKIGFLNIKPKRYNSGKVNVATNSNKVVGIGTQWNTGMFPAWIVVAGYPYEVLKVDSATSLTLAIDYLGNSASSVEYAINYSGIGVWLEPGTDFSQYGKEWSLNGRCGCALFASSGSTSPKYTGTSRIKVLSGYLNGEGIADSIAGYFGPYSDTFVWDVAMNSFAFGVVVANGHQHDIQHGDYENAGGPVPVTGKPLEYNSCHGILVMADNTNDGWGNRLGGYFRQVGTAMELYGKVNETQIGVSTFRSNKATLVIGPDATNTNNPFKY